MTLSASMLSRNFEKTVALMKEILLEPRWDTTEFRIAQTRTRNNIIQAQAQPSRVAELKFFELLYGKDNIFGYSSMGTRESIDKITLNDLKDYYNRCLSPKVTRVLLAGNVTKEQVLTALESFRKDWKATEVTFNNYPAPPAPDKSTIYFVDIPGSRQSVIYLGYPALSRSNPDWIKADFINYRLGGAFTSILNQILREQKGFTYGAHSYFQEMKSIAPFVAYSSVRSDATLESMKIFKDEMEKYRQGLSEADLQFVKNCMLRSDALRFETNDALVGMLSTMTKYGLPEDYIKQEDNVIRNLTVEDTKAIAEKYVVPDKMIYVVVGDAATQMKPLEKIGFGKPVLIKNK
jgi:zinc protease